LPVVVKYFHNSLRNNTVKLRTNVNSLKSVFGGDHIIGVYGITTNQHGQTEIVMEYCAKEHCATTWNPTSINSPGRLDSTWHEKSLKVYVLPINKDSYTAIYTTATS
jgi:hypothetical protein